MSTTLTGLRDWSLKRDEDGQRTYTVKWDIEATSKWDGPLAVMSTAGLPAIGSFFNIEGNIDAWAFASPEMSVETRVKAEPNFWWILTQKFTTKGRERCEEQSVEDPLSEPQKISGSFVNYLKEATKDRNGDAIKSSSHERFRGPAVEFDAHRATVQIEQNTATLGLSTFTDMMNTVNDATLWGMPARSVKLSNVTWRRKLYGLCYFYYTRRFEFDVSFEDDGFDREIADEGTKALNGEWEDGVWTIKSIGGVSPDIDNPNHFVRYHDQKGNLSPVRLNGSGEPITDEADQHYFTVEYYPESNFLSLGIPATL